MIILDKKYNLLLPLKNSNLSRFGNKYDGGYVVDRSIMENCNQLITFGLGSDWSFESEYILKNKKSKIHIYDYTVNFYEFLKPTIKYLRRFLTFRCNFKPLKTRVKFLYNFLKFINLKEVTFFKEKVIFPITSKKEVDIKKAFSRIENLNQVILKIDIEGSEFELIDQINLHSKNIKMLIFEFHWLEKNEDIFMKSIKSLKKNFDIIHLHGNNHCKQLLNGLPSTLEITMINSSLRPLNIEHVKKFPIKNLDFPNNPNKEDIFFSFED